MAGINKVIIVGNLGKDPESRSFSNGGKVVNLTVATSETWKDKSSGEQKEKTEWHKVAIFNENLAGIAEKYLRKGSKVYLEGKIQTRKYQDTGGQDRYITEVVLQGYDCKLMGLDSRQQRSADDDYGAGDYGRGGATQPPASRTPDRGTNTFSSDLEDDDVPF